MPDSMLKLKKRKPKPPTHQYEHPIEELRYIRRYELVPVHFLREMSPEAVKAVIKIHKKKLRKRRWARRSLTLLSLVMITVGIKTFAPDLDFISAPVSNLTHASREIIGLKTQEQKEVEARLLELIVQPLGSEEDSFAGPRWSRQ